MPIHQAPPGDRGEREFVHVPHQNVRNKENWIGYSGGRCHWYWCHEVGKKTKPCLTKVTDGELDCPWCRVMNERRVFGYQPLFRALDSKPVHVRVADGCRDQIDKLRFHERVQVGRGPVVGDVVYVLRLSEQTPLFQTTDPFKSHPVDLTRSLLRMWGIAELIQWYNLTEAMAVPEPKKEEPKSDSPSSLTEKITQGEHGTVGDYVDHLFGNIQERNRRFAEGVQRGKDAAKNGKHRKTDNKD